ncbi:MAG: ABC transporter substrate-binding protein [Acidisphaera sp.]|nr:ABC transporter substrate-binding protein [Acidisphaera sp.]
MKISRRTLLAATAASAIPSLARAQKPTIRIGVLNDQSGPYRDDGGMVSVQCAQLAAEEFAPHADFAIEVISADHQNKPDVGASIARQWFDRDGVDMIADLPTSSVALAVAAIAHERNKAVVTSGAGTSALTGPQCSPNTVQWTYDTYMLSHSTAGSVVKTGGDSWFFITADYTFGHQLQEDAARVVTQAGGRVLGNVAYPFPGTADFSSFLVRGRSSGAKVIGLANAGDDAANCIKQGAEFGLGKAGIRVAALLIQLRGVKSIGLQTAQGLLLTESYYWDLNDRTRAFNARILKKNPAQYPSMTQAGCYAATTHYLKAVASLGAAAAKADGRAVVDRMKALPCDDDVFGHYRVREDGRVLNPAYLFQVKSPAESKNEWDIYKLVASVPGDQAFRPLGEGGCPFIKA